VRIGPELADRFEGGSAKVVGTVDADGIPHATRAWGARVIDDGAALRIYLDGDDPVVAGTVTEHSRLAVTGGSVSTLISAQVKGRVRGVEDLTAPDVIARQRGTAAFIQDVHETDHTPRVLLEAMVPSRFVACVVDVEELYDQTPGPRAGTALPTEAP